jgi:RNA polymerase sigma factor (sigma-70 family)
LVNKNPLSEAELIKSCARNERKAQEELYRQHFTTMMRLVRRYCDDQNQAVEILNDGFLKVFKGIGTFQSEGSLEGWIRKIIFRSVSDYYRTKKKNLELVEIQEASGETNQSDTLQGLYYEDLIKLLELIPPASAKVFRLFALEGYSHQEISEEIGITIGTSKWHVADAREKLKHLITKGKVNYI